MKKVQLVLIDEVHLLHEKRGATLEGNFFRISFSMYLAVVSRMKLIKKKEKSNLRYLEWLLNYLFRFIALSATIPNISDVAEWLNVPKEGTKHFSENFRPVPVRYTILIFT